MKCTLAFRGLLAGAVWLQGCAQVNTTLDKLDRMAIERMGEAEPVVDKGIINLPYDQVVANLSELPVDDVTQQRETVEAKGDWIRIPPPAGYDPGAWAGGGYFGDSPALIQRSQYRQHLGLKNGEFTRFSREFRYADGYPATKCKTACKITILLEPTSDGKTDSYIEYSGDGDITVFTKAMRRMIRNVLEGKPADAPEKSDLSRWIGSEL